MREEYSMESRVMVSVWSPFENRIGAKRIIFGVFEVSQAIFLGKKVFMPSSNTDNFMGWIFIGADLSSNHTEKMKLPIKQFYS